MKRRICFILNPKAGSGLNKSIEESIKKILCATDIEIELNYTAYAGHATELCKLAVETKFNVVAAVGGDGTINETAKALKFSNTALAIIPTGSGNGFARHFSIPMNLDKAIAVIAKGKSILVDSLMINQKFCINISGAGFDAYIAHLFANYGKRGFNSYLKLIIKEYFSYKEKKYTIEFDGNKINTKAFLIAVANASQFGNGAKISPLAKPDDGFIDLTVIKKIPVHGIIPTIVKVFCGTLHKSSYAEIIKGKSFIITSDETVAIHIDGEPIEPGKKITATIDPLSVKLIVP